MGCAGGGLWAEVNGWDGLRASGTKHYQQAITALEGVDFDGRVQYCWVWVDGCHVMPSGLDGQSINTGVNKMQPQCLYDF